MSADPDPETPDAYTNTEADNYPFARERSRPGTDPRDQVYEKVKDSTGRLVSDKPANRAFLTSQAKRQAHADRLAADKARRAQNPSQSSWTPIILFILFLPLLSSFLTGSYTFNTASTVLPPIKRFIRNTPLNPFKTPLKTFSPRQLAKFDGRDPWLPVYVAIDGEVYDVSKNRRVYGKGGSYNMMAGRDASRSFVTGCFQTHLTHDLRGLSADELKSLDHWKSFFANHNDYKLIGRVHNPDIDPNSPIPPSCHDGADQPAPGHVAAHHGAPAPGPVQAHEEL